MKKDIFLNIALPVFIAVIISLLISLTNTDLEIEKLFYSPEKGGWFMGQEMPWYFLYHYGNVPAIIIAAGPFWFLSLVFSARLYCLTKK